MTYCQYIRDPNILELVQNCDTDFFKNLKINRTISTGAYGVVFIVTTTDEYQNSFALKLQLVLYDPKLKHAKYVPEYHGVSSLNTVVYTELLALCRFKDLLHNGIADQFPELERYFVCSLKSVAEPFNEKLLTHMETYTKEPPEQNMDVSIISMSYIHGDTLADTKTVPRTAVFDFYYGLFAIFLYGRMNIMEDLHSSNILISKTDVDTYFKVTYDDIFQDDIIDVIVKIPKGYPRLKFIDFGRAADIINQRLDRKSTLLKPHDVMVSLDPSHLIRIYRTAQNTKFPLIEEYSNKIRKNPDMTVYELFNYIMSLVTDYVKEFVVDEIPDNSIVYSLEFPR